MTDEQFDRLMAKLEELKTLQLINGRPVYLYPQPLVPPQDQWPLNSTRD